MVEYKCPYSGTLVSGQFACAMAKTVVRRGGAEVECTLEAGHRRCTAIFQQMKQAALPVFGVEDDLLSMPHSVLIKIQHGGLLGLQRIMGETARPTVVTAGPGTGRSLPSSGPSGHLLPSAGEGECVRPSAGFMGGAPASTVADINALCERAVLRFQDAASIPYQTFVQDMTAYKLKRRATR